MIRWLRVRVRSDRSVFSEQCPRQCARWPGAVVGMYFSCIWPHLISNNGIGHRRASLVMRDAAEESLKTRQLVLVWGSVIRDVPPFFDMAGASVSRYCASRGNN